MAASSTLTVRLSEQTKSQLTTLAGRTRRTRSFLAAEAIASYVSRELAIVDAVEQGRADIRAGHFTSNEDVLNEADAMIAAARKAR